MGVTVVCGITLILLTVLLYVVKGNHHNNTEPAPKKTISDGECCGKHAVCQKGRLAELAAKKELYFEDENLDCYIGRSSDSYSEEEVEEFRYVMNTMLPQEIAKWIESLTVRGVEFPDQLKDEAYMFL
ncbi:MAG: phospholipase [Bacteroidaceae bacterium]|nr:phospholipase [Bacteroidaceae bacterium]